MKDGSSQCSHQLFIVIFHAIHRSEVENDPPHLPPPLPFSNHSRTQMLQSLRDAGTGILLSFQESRKV